MRGTHVEEDIARHRLHRRLSTAVDALPEQPSTPTYVVDLDEHVEAAHLLAGSSVVETVPTYRGTGHAW